jgi:hypothetical protein
MRDLRICCPASDRIGGVAGQALCDADMRHNDRILLALAELPLRREWP